MDKLQKLLIWATIILLPLEKLGTFDMAGFTFKPAYLPAIGIIIYWAVRLKSLKEVKLAAYEWALLLFWAVSLLTTLWSGNSFLSLALNLVILLSFIIFFIVRRSLGKINIETLISVFVWLGVATAIFGFWQFAGDSLGLSQSWTGISTIYLKDVFGFPRVQSTFFEPSFYGNFLLMPLYLSIYLAISKKRAVNYLQLLIIATVFFLTLSRGAFIALGLSFVVLILGTWLWRPEYLKKLGQAMVLILFSFAMALFAVYLSSGTAGAHNYLRQVKNSEDVISGDKYNELSPNRGYTVRVALNNVVKHPFGIGTGAFGTLSEFAEIRAAGNLRQTVNSIYPEVLIETGFLGLFLFLSFIVLLLRELFLRARKSYLAIILLVAVLACFIQFWSFSTYYLLYIWVFLAFAAAPGQGPEGETGPALSA